MIGTGLVMFVFVTMHLANLALGLISLQLMEDWRWALSGVWSSVLPLRFLLQVSLILHFLLALHSLYWRNTLRVPAYDMAQMVAGVLIIPLLAKHVFGVMAIKELGLEPTYAIVLGQFWVVSPFDGLQQIVMLVVAWIHGAIGVYTWLQSRDGSARVMRFFYPFVVALPILAMLGYVEAGRQIIPVDEGGMGLVLDPDPNANGPTVAREMIPVIIDQAKDRQEMAIRVSLALVAIVLLLRWLRLRRISHSAVRVTYAGVRPATFDAETGLTLLEMARDNDVPHASVCRGRGRCGTCRVRVLSGGESLPAPSEMEASVLERWHAGPDERLACQVKPSAGPLEVERVIEADYSNLDYAETRRPTDHPAGASS
jgi:adenylate cyclase